MVRYGSYSILRYGNGDYFINVWDEDDFTLAQIGAFTSNLTADRRARELGLTRNGGALPEGLPMVKRVVRAAPVATKTFDEAWADGIARFKK